MGKVIKATLYVKEWYEAEGDLKNNNLREKQKHNGIERCCKIIEESPCAAQKVIMVITAKPLLSKR